MMTRELAIFLETIDDLCFEGYTEFLILAYHEFISEIDFGSVTDIQVHARAKEIIKKYQDFWYSDVTFFEDRNKILDQLDLEGAEWEYLELDDNRGNEDERICI